MKQTMILVSLLFSLVACNMDSSKEASNTVDSVALKASMVINQLDTNLIKEDSSNVILDTLSK